MQMNKIIIGILVAAFGAFNSFALTMDEAVDSALSNNFEILMQKHKVQSQEFLSKAAETPYYPQFDAKYTYADSNEKAYGTVEDTYSAFTLELGYNLFNGFSDKYRKAAAESSVSAQKHSLDAVKQDITLSAKKAYISVLKALDNIKVANKATQLLENQLKDTKLSYEVGYVAKNEVLKVEAELAASKQAVLSANSAFRTAVFNLEKIIGKELPKGEKFHDLSTYTGSIESFESLKTDMMKNRSEIKYIKENINALGYNIKAENGGYFPKVNIGASYNSYGDDASPSGRDYAYDNETVLSANVSINIFDGFKKKNTSASIKADKLALIAQLRDTKANMTLQLKNAIEGFELAQASLETAEKELESARENYRITQNQFRQKVATNTDLLDARVMLTRAENTYSSARYSIQQALADLERIVQK
jgi:outer membrane protein TolC